MDKQQDFVLRTIEERGVKFVRLWFTDVVGTLKSVAVAPAEVEGAFAEGVGFDGSAIEGLTRSFEADVLAHPDPSTFQILPWRGDVDPAARMFCDITTPDGQPAQADPRNVLKRTLAKAADKGFTFYTHPEIEFYLLNNSDWRNGGARPIDQAGYFDNVPGGKGHDFRRRAVRMLEDLGISVERGLLSNRWNQYCERGFNHRPPGRDLFGTCHRRSCRWDRPSDGQDWINGFGE
jgi:glutamine synthetase